MKEGWYKVEPPSILPLHEKCIRVPAQPDRLIELLEMQGYIFTPMIVMTPEEYAENLRQSQKVAYDGGYAAGVHSKEAKVRWQNDAAGISEDD